MIGILGPMQIEEVLSKQLIGRIACCNDGVPYVVPISYAYDGKDLYFHTREGKKVQMMRANPQVCFQVDHMHTMADWESVIAWGTFEEVAGKEEREHALKLLIARALPLISSVTTHFGKTWPFMQEPLSENIQGVLFRIRIKEKSGRFENNIHSPLFSE